MTSVTSLGAQELSYLSGLSATEGYQVLNKNLGQAVTNFEKTPQTQSAITYFEQTVPTLKSVNDFLSNTRLVDFVLSAFGLDQEDNYQGLVKEVLTQDPNSSSSLVNQLTDPRFKQLATALDFYNDGLGQLQAVGLADPTGASSAEGVSLTPTYAKGTSTSTASVVKTPTPTTTINTSIAVGIGVQLSGNQYLVLQQTAGASTSIGIQFSDNEYLQVQEPDGSTGYTQSGTFSLNSNNQLALPDGSVLQLPVTIPSDTTSINISSTGEIEAQESGQSSPTNLGQLQTATFTDPTSLSTDANGYYTPTTASGAATIANATSPSTYGPTVYAQSGYFTVNSNGQLQLADGTVLQQPSISVPGDATSIGIGANGVITAEEPGQDTPTVLGQLQTATFTDPTSLSTDSNGYATPTTASGSATIANSNSGISTFGATNQVVQNVTPTVTSTSTAAVSVGIGVSGNQYLVLQQANGNTVYAKSAYFTVNSNNELALPDGSTLQPSIILPAGTTAVTISSGSIYAQVAGQSKPENVGQLETATFANAANLSKGSNGYYTPTTGSGSANLSFVTGTSYTFGSTLQTLVNDYVQNEFEVAVGDDNAGVREALYFQRTIGPDEASAASYGLTTQADVILGDSVLSNVVETALDQPAQIAYEQLSSQEQIIETGVNIKDLQTPSYVAQFTARYLTMYDASHAASSQASNSPALQILSAFGSSDSSSSSSSSAAQTILSLSV